ncbi:quinone-dependent dihydroorotate dehydrogenase [Sneathiella marina]|uniref:Dihydroorotate dehydrogenase (quinone) n=1 Tax=Sneathiella marina TaxID=2950108 RepID=A0ABY4W0R3_9PROT|nr:quinone-dependent dihydroorotate dehydrogenase [Sneathiella marina]USG60771.1 quinone-dependent dihydroorotate dehydrogenase [Sneathiella marina]
MSLLYRLAKPLFFSLDAEDAHNLSIKALKSGLLPAVKSEPDPILQSNVFGLDFPTPIGLSAGYDKNAEVLDPLAQLGFGFIEAGSVTPFAQAGNPKPRIFRMRADNAIVNRLGFNNQGLDVAAANFSSRKSPGIVGANLGANKDSTDRMHDYVLGMQKLAPLADYVTVNISSPNTPGLRSLHGKEELEELLGRLHETRNDLVSGGLRSFPILLKIAPDLTDDDKADIAAAALEYSLDGLIISNTTISRPHSLQSKHAVEAGGLSGTPLKSISLSVLKDMYRATSGKIPLIGVGGIETAEDALMRIKAGASLLQLYTAMVYRGPYVAHDIGKGVAKLLRKQGYSSITESVGVDTPL